MTKKMGIIKFINEVTTNIFKDLYDIKNIEINDIRSELLDLLGLHYSENYQSIFIKDGKLFLQNNKQIFKNIEIKKLIKIILASAKVITCHISLKILVLFWIFIVIKELKTSDLGTQYSSMIIAFIKAQQNMEISVDSWFEIYDNLSFELFKNVPKYKLNDFTERIIELEKLKIIENVKDNVWKLVEDFIDEKSFVDRLVGYLTKKNKQLK